MTTFLGNYFGETPEEIKAKAAVAFRPLARAIKEDPQKAKEIIAPTIQDPEQRAKFEAQLEPMIQQQKKEASAFSTPLIISSVVTVASLVAFLLLRRKRKAKNPNEQHLCGWCRVPTDHRSGFCSLECEKLYGCCPSCSSPSRGSRLCFECRELGLKNPFKRRHRIGYGDIPVEEKLYGPTQWQIEFESVTGSHGTKTYKTYDRGKKALSDLDKRDDIKWSSLRRVL